MYESLSKTCHGSTDGHKFMVPCFILFKDKEKVKTKGICQNISIFVDSYIHITRLCIVKILYKNTSVECSEIS